jgi:hypothetical protein
MFQDDIIKNINKFIELYSAYIQSDLQKINSNEWKKKENSPVENVLLKTKTFIEIFDKFDKKELILKLMYDEIYKNYTSIIDKILIKKNTSKTLNMERDLELFEIFSDNVFFKDYYEKLYQYITPYVNKFNPMKTVLNIAYKVENIITNK